MVFQTLHKYSQALAIFLALIAQYLFTGEFFTHQHDSNTWVWTTKYSLALLLLLVAIAFAGWGAFPSRYEENEEDDFPSSSSNQLNRVKTWLIISAILYLVCIVIFISYGENSLVRWSWVGGIAFLIIPLWLQGKEGQTDPQISSWEWIVVGIAALIGFGLRYWKLTEIPSHVDNDVALMGTYGLDLIRGNKYSWIGFSGSEHLLSYDQFLAWSMRLFGQDHYGIVMVSVLLGTLSLIFIFLLGRELGGRFVGFAALGLLTISYTHIHFSRILFGNTASFAMIFVAYTLLKGMRTGAPVWFALAGVCTGWGILLYDSARVIPVILGSILLWQWLFHRESFKFNYKNWGILFLGFLLGLGPMLAYAITNFSEFSGRANVVVLWTPVAWEHQLAAYNTTSPFEVVWQQVWRTFLTLHLTGDGSPHFSLPRPMVDPLTALLFILGVGYAITRIKSTKYFSLFSWIILTFIFGGVLTADPPYWPHLNIALPAIVLLAALGAQSLGNTIVARFDRIGYQVYIPVIVSVLLFAGINNWSMYYDFVKNNAGNRIRIARYLETLPASYYIYMISDNFGWNEHAFRFFSQGMAGMDLTAESLISNPPELDAPTVFILFRHPELVPVLEDLYPEGILENHYDVNNLVSFISYRTAPSTADASSEGVVLSRLGSPGWQWIFGLIIFWVGYVAYGHYSALENYSIRRRS